MDTTPEIRKKLEEYLCMGKPSAVPMIFAVVILIIALANPGIGLLALLFVIFPRISRKRKMRALFRKFEEADQMELVLSDFQNGTFLCSGAVCLGEHVMMGWGADEIFFYDELAEVCQCAETGYHNSVINKRELYVRRKTDILEFEERYRSRKGERLGVIKGQRLCLFKGTGVNEEELNKVYQFIQSKNPDIWIDPEIRYEAEDIVT